MGKQADEVSKPPAAQGPATPANARGVKREREDDGHSEGANKSWRKSEPGPKAKDMSKVKCFKCKKWGHMIVDCKQE